MHLQSADEVWTRIEALVRAEGPGGATGVVATDGDGTLWSGDVGEDIFYAFIESGQAEPPALEAMREEARRHALSDAGSGPDVARRIYAAYLEGQFPEELVCEVMTWCLAGWTLDRVRAFAREVIDRGGLGARVNADVLRVLQRARAAGLETILVSASPFAIVAEAGGRLGFDEKHIVAAQPRFEAGVMLPGVHRPIPYGDGKVSRLRERIGPSRTLYAAFGDNAFDVALLASARVGVAVRPKPRLRERAHEVPGLVELAPAEMSTRTPGSSPPC